MERDLAEIRVKQIILAEYAAMTRKKEVYLKLFGEFDDIFLNFL